MSNPTVLVGVGGGIVGLLIGTMMSGPDLGALETRLVDKIDAQGAAASEATVERLAALEEQLTGVQAAMDKAAEANDGVGAAVSTQIDGAVTSLSGKLDTVSQTINESIASASASQTASFNEALGNGMNQITSAVSEISVAAPAALAAVEAPAAAAVEAQASAPAVVEISGVKVGQTENLLDGKARVFVSGLNAEASTARVAINGLSLKELGPYQNVTFDADGVPCTLVLDDIVQGHVQMSATCDE